MCDSILNSLMETQCMPSPTRKSKNKNKRRFNDEQIKFLETMFEAESRPELLMKQQLAIKLGLQPRQVAIWFQNRRARSKSKQIERDYTTLKLRYDNLASKFESLKKENQSLVIQLQRLQKLTEHSGGEEREIKNCMPAQNDNGLNVMDCEHEPGRPLLYSDKSEKTDYLEVETDVPSIAHVPDASLTSDENMSCFVPSEFLEASGCSSEWWVYDP